MKTRYGMAIGLTTLLPAMAWAHPGHDLPGFAQGVLHPLTGLDHLLVMLAVGAWAAQLGGRLRVWVPTTFVCLMLFGALAGASGAHVGAIQQGIAASMCVLGLLLAGAVRLPKMLCLPMVGAFAVFHGYAHGVEMPQQAGAALYMSGFVFSTIALQLAGIAMGTWLLRHRQAVLRWSGAAMAATGLVLLVA